MELQNTLPGMEFSDEDEYDKEEYMTRKPKREKFSKTDDKNDLYATLENSVKTKTKSGHQGIKAKEESADELELESEPDENTTSDLDMDADIAENPLLEDLNFGSKSEKKALNSDIWFSKDSFDFLNDNNEENNELIRCIEMEEELNEELNEKREKTLNRKRKRDVVESFNKDFEEAEDNDTNYDDLKKEKSQREDKKESNKIDIVPKLNAEELALGQMITNSKKTKGMLIDDSYNRYSKFDDDDNLPEWFLEDEQEHFKKPPKIPKQIVHDYKKRFDDINARPIKKVVEAEARKKRRVRKTKIYLYLY